MKLYKHRRLFDDLWRGAWIAHPKRSTQITIYMKSCSNSFSRPGSGICEILTIFRCNSHRIWTEGTWSEASGEKFSRLSAENFWFFRRGEAKARKPWIMSPKMPLAILMDKFPIIYKRSPRFCGRNFLLPKTSKRGKNTRKDIFGRKFPSRALEPKKQHKNGTRAAGDMISIDGSTSPTFLSRHWHSRWTESELQQFSNFFCNSTLQFHSGRRRLTGQQLDTKIEIFSENNCSPRGPNERSDTLILFWWCAVWCKQN